MKKLLVGFAAMLALGAAAPAGSAEDTATTLDLPKPAWLTPALEAQIIAAGPRGVDVPARNAAGTVEVNCLGTSPPYAGTDGVSVNAVSAGGCMVSPHGCTLNFVFSDGTSNYIGTAGHCTNNGQTVIAQVATRVDPTDTVMATLAAIGTTVASWNNGIGKDFALIRIDPAFRVVPGVAGALGPTGVFCGDPVGQPVMHYGHGYIFFVEQGDPKFGEVVPDLSLVFPFTTANGFNWVGYGLPGDSGSEVMDAAGLAVGDLTHGLAPLGVPVPGISFGTDMAGIFNLIGPGYTLVTVDGRHVGCSGLIGI
jgi:hypothetical protein